MRTVQNKKFLSLSIREYRCCERPAIPKQIATSPLEGDPTNENLNCSSYDWNHDYTFSIYIYIYIGDYRSGYYLDLQIQGYGIKTRI